MKICQQCKKSVEKPYNRSLKSWKDFKFCSRSCKHISMIDKPAWNKGTKGIMKSNKTSFKKGIKPWNTGKKLPYPVWNKGLFGVLKMAKRENSPHWRGGKGGELHLLRLSIDYKLWREAVFKRDNFTCKDCKTKGGHLEAHHIKPFAYFPELRFAIDNGVTLCPQCHAKVDIFRVRTINRTSVKNK